MQFLSRISGQAVLDALYAIAGYEVYNANVHGKLKLLRRHGRDFRAFLRRTAMQLARGGHPAR